MAEEEKKSVFSKYIIPLIIILAVIIVAIYAWAWFGSEAGQRQLGSIQEFAKKYNPITLIQEQYKETQRSVSWTAETNPEAEKQGIMLNSFSAFSKKIQGGSELMLKYDLKVNIPPTYSIPTDFNCTIPGTGIQGEIIPSTPITITAAKKPTVRCKFSETQTETLLGATKVEGGFTFPYTTKDVKLPVYFAREEAEDFFEKYGMPERNPIKAQYNQEPVELAIGVSDADVQPVIVAEDEYPMVGLAVNNRWGGKIKSITALELELPEEAVIKGEPTQTCPFELVKSEKGRNLYRAQASLLNDIVVAEYTPTVFECWLDISPDIIPADADYSKKEYTAMISYVYSVSPKIEVVTVE